MDVQQTLTVNRKQYKKFALVSDIGGTNSRFGIVGIKENEIKLLFHFVFKTKQIDYYEKINEVLKRAYDMYGIEICDFAVGIAGKVQGKKVKLTNGKFELNVDEIFAKTMLGNIILLNDFEAAAYGINTIDQTNEIKAIIGPGTGLGKGIIVIDKPLPSEGGHSELVYKKEEEKFIEFIKKKEKIKQVTWENVLSGRGLRLINEFITGKKLKTEEIKNKKVFEEFGKYLARCCRNFALEVLPTKIYIIGGIAQGHLEMFNKNFRKEFENGFHKDYLKSVPVEVITDPFIALTGAGYSILKKKGFKRN